MSKVFVFCIDALCACDVDDMRGMPHFGPFLQKAAVVKRIEPTWPAVTYSCHTSIITGCYIDRHGVAGCEKILRGGHLGSPWYKMKEDVKVPTLLDRAREHGLTTCSLSWPVTGAAKYDLNMPMIVPYDYVGFEPRPYLEHTATRELLDRYFYKHGRLIMGRDRSLDLYTMAMAHEILEDYEQPDIMLVKMCDLDGYRHEHGVHHPRVAEQLRKHDEEFGGLMEALRRKGTLEDTNVVILGDHGMTNYRDILHMNVLLRDNGFIRTGEGGTLESFDAIIHSSGFTAYVELADPGDAAMREKVRAFLESLRDDPCVKLDYVLDRKEAKERFHVDGPFDFIIETTLPISMSERLDCDCLWGSELHDGRRFTGGDHGGGPTLEEVTAFLAAGPDVRAGAVVERRPMVDEAPTLARMLGFELNDVDGAAIEEVLI